MPWTREYNEAAETWRIEDGSGLAWADCLGSGHDVMSAHIVHCVNLHEELVSTLEQVTEWMRAHCGPKDSCHEMLCSAVETLQRAGGTIR